MSIMPPRRIWARDYGGGLSDDCVWFSHDDLGGQEYVRADIYAAQKAKASESALDALAADGQAGDAYGSQMAAEADRDRYFAVFKDNQAQDTLSRQLGLRDGFSHALISVVAIRNNLTGPNGCYIPPKHHVRKRAAVMSRAVELDKAIAAIQRHMDEILTALKGPVA